MPGGVGMSGWSRYCDCAVWVEASKCSGNTSDLRVFVHEDDLPSSASWFAFDSQDTQINCWKIDPGSERVCLPQEDGVYAYSGPFPWTSCSECEEQPEDDGDGTPGGGGSGGGGAGGGGSGGGGSGGGGWPWPEHTPKGIKVTVCSDHRQRAIDRGWDVDHLYVGQDSERESSTIADVGGICISVPSGPVVEDPDPAYWIGVGSGDGFDSCSDCTDGVKASLCPDDQNQPGAGDAPEIWIRASDLADAPDGFEYGIWCYQVNQSPREVIPDGALLLLPTQDLPCDQCNRGVQYQLCPGEPEPGQEYWAEDRDINELLEKYPDSTTVIMRINGYCHSLDLAGSTQRIPTDAVRVPPRCQFATCFDCVCGGGLDLNCKDEPVLGVPVRLCSGQNAANWSDTWMPEDRLPAARTYFRHRGYCVFIDPSDTPSAIPADAQTLNQINNRYASCLSCRGWGWNPPGGGGGGGGGGFPPPPPPPPPPQMRWFRLWECGVGNTTKWVQLPRFTKIRAGKVDGKCHVVRHPGRITLPNNAQVVGLADTRQGFAGQGCGLFGRGECEPLYHLQDCDFKLLPRTVDTDLAAIVGQVVYKAGRCWQIREGDGGGPINELLSYDGPYPDCPSCDEIFWLKRCDGNASKFTRTDLSGSAGKIVKIDGSDECWQVQTTTQLDGDQLEPVTVTETFDTCEECEDGGCGDPDCDCGNFDCSEGSSGLTTAWHLQHCLGINVSGGSGCAPHPCCPGMFIQFDENPGDTFSPSGNSPWSGSGAYTYTITSSC